MTKEAKTNIKNTSIFSYYRENKEFDLYKTVLISFLYGNQKNWSHKILVCSILFHFSTVIKMLVSWYDYGITRKRK